MGAKTTPDPVGSQLVSLEVDVEVDADAWSSVGASLEADCRRCCQAAFSHVQRLGEFDDEGIEAAEIAIRLTTDAELQALNRQFRGIDKPTNVLSFATLDDDGPAMMEGMPLYLGDIAVACETVTREAREQNKSVAEHLSHMIVHGTLHLLGYDHEDDTEAQEMEALECQILAGLGIADPYLAMEEMS